MTSDKKKKKEFTQTANLDLTAALVAKDLRVYETTTATPWTTSLKK